MSTPVRRQYLDIKARYPDAILFFRLGDFYETFDADAELVSRELEIALTSKPLGKGLRVPLAGVPVQSVETHLARLIRKGHRVAICEQLEDPRATKGLVERGVVRVVSPGTALEPALLEQGANNYCAALALLPQAGGEGERSGLAALDLSTGEFRVCELRGRDPHRRALDELARLGASELLVPDGPDRGPDPFCPRELPGGSPPAAFTKRPPSQFQTQEAAEALLRHYRVESLEGLGLADRPAAVAAAGALLRYLMETQPGRLAHLDRPRPYDPSSTMLLDRATVRALGLFPDPHGESGRDSGSTGPSPSLLSHLDRTRTAMGRRLLRGRLLRPLLDLERIEERLDRVAVLVSDPLRRRRVGEGLARVPDLERLLARISAGLAAPAEAAALAGGLRSAAALRAAVGAPTGDDEAPVLERILAELPPCSEIEGAIASVLEERPAANFEEGGVVRPGVDAGLDTLRAQMRSGRAALAAFETQERRRTGIANLRVGYHRTFGYYLEVTGGQLGRVPADFERRQTLAGGERFATPELRRLEEQVLTARDALSEREREIFSRLCAQIGVAAAEIRSLAGGVARLDLACSLAEVAVQRGYTRPHLDRSDALFIREGRHPVVEAALPRGRFVPNDLHLRADGEQVLVLTGPNMAGKSTYLRQGALVVLLAQIGSFVPAAEARIGLVDRIFARVGAHDDLAAGQSTFLVEMLEMANILANATDRSLLVLDEIGRGTSTYDGLAIARALLEHLASGPVRGPRTLFATHFHELTALAGERERVVNASVAVSESDGAVHFLHRIVPGGADRSYGIHVAEMAGLPAALLARARTLLADLEAQGRGSGDRRVGAPAPAQLPLLSALASGGGPPPLLQEPLLQEIASLDVDALTPLEAIAALYALRSRAQEACGEGER